MPVPPITYRLTKGQPLTPAEMDENMRLLANFSNALEALFNVALNPDGTLKPGAIDDVDMIEDRLIDNSKLNWLFNNFGTATTTSTNTYVLPLNPNTAFAKGDGATTALVVFVKFTDANTGPATLNINADGAQSIVKGAASGPGLSPLVSGDIQAGGIGCIVWNGTNYQLIGLIPPPSGASSSVLFPLFRAHRNGVISSFTTGVASVFKADVDNLSGAYDPYSTYNTTTWRWVPGVVGYYHLHGQIVPAVSNLTSYLMSIYIYKNGAAIAQKDYPSFTYTGTERSPILDIAVDDYASAATDYYQLFAIHNNAFNQDFDGNALKSYFEGYRIPISVTP